MTTEISIQDIFNVSDLPGQDGESFVVYKPLELVDVESNPKNRTPDLESDYSAVRTTLHHQNQMLMDAAKIFLETAKNADSPRHMEVFSTLMNQMTATNKELLRLHKDMKDITNENVTVNKNNGNGMNIENAQVFVGSTSQFMDELENEDYLTTENENGTDT